MGARLPAADRVLVSGKIASVLTLPLAQPTGVSAVLTNAEGQLLPAAMFGKRLVAFNYFEVEPKKARLIPEITESVDTGRPYLNNAVTYYGNATRTYAQCPPTQRRATDKQMSSNLTHACPSGTHLDLGIDTYNPSQLDQVGSRSRGWYPVRDGLLTVLNFKIRVHDVTGSEIVIEVVQDHGG